jgi:hypothetical protein
VKTIVKLIQFQSIKKKEKSEKKVFFCEIINKFGERKVEQSGVSIKWKKIFLAPANGTQKI